MTNKEYNIVQAYFQRLDYTMEELETTFDVSRADIVRLVKDYVRENKKLLKYNLTAH